MAGRGDNNKHGTSGQGSSNQSNQPFGASEGSISFSSSARKLICLSRFASEGVSRWRSLTFFFFIDAFES